MWSPSSAGPPNVLLLEGFLWHMSEAAISALLARLQPVGIHTVRLYDDPNSGASRGIAFVEIAPAATAILTGRLLQEFAGRLRQEHPTLRTTLCYLTNSSWDRGGRLPDLPWESQPLLAQLRQAEGYGSQGFLERAVCAACPNTATDSGQASLAQWRKRMRSPTSELAAELEP